MTLVTSSITMSDLLLSPPTGSGSPRPPAYSFEHHAIGLGLGALTTSISAPVIHSPCTPLPSYHQLPSLEPWLRLVRSDIHFDTASTPLENTSRAALDLFMPSHIDGWTTLHAQLANALKAWGLSRDPHEDVRIQLWPETPYTRRRIATDAEWMPTELQNTALWMTQSKEVAFSVSAHALDVSPVLYDALGRQAENRVYAQRLGLPASTMPAITSTNTRIVSCLPSQLRALLFHAGLPQADFDHMARALFMLQARQVFVRAAQAQIQARASSRVYCALARVLKLPHGLPQPETN